MTTTDTSVLSPSLFLEAVAKQLSAVHTVVAYTLGECFIHYVGPRAADPRITLVLRNNRLLCDFHPLGTLTLTIGNMTMANARMTASLIETATFVAAAPSSTPKEGD